jgi:hypothetical protein
MKNQVGTMVFWNGKTRFGPWYFGPENLCLGHGLLILKAMFGPWSSEPEKAGIVHWSFGPEKAHVNHGWPRKTRFGTWLFRSESIVHWLLRPENLQPRI